jgi:phage tail-like protein
MPVARPFTAFNFSVELVLGNRSDLVCGGSFSECDGLEVTMDAKSIREGGNNATLIRLAGPMGYGQLTLRRGMTDDGDLWTWFEEFAQDPSLRAEGEVVLFAPDGQEERGRFLVSRCVPLKLKAPPLNAKDGLLAIEELQLGYETLRFRGPSGG